MIDIRMISPLSSAEIPQSYKDGGKAHQEGIKVESNPNPKGSKSYEDWEHGWYDSEGYQEYQQGNLDMVP